ncbi:MAG: FAD-dependent oxidoreductase, partial [Nitrospirales bacterium]|nr:FAD-dependent oxidoreductase [Nitrospirales bacterium]
YPEAKRLLDYAALHLYPFSPGAIVRHNGKWHRILDPFRIPSSAFRTLFAPIGTLSDKFRMALFRRRVLRGTIQELFSSPETSSMQHLQNIGFTASMIDVFFRPFLAGIFLDNTLETSSRMMEFVFRMFASGDTALPAGGMEAIPRQLQSRLQPENIRTNTEVISLQETSLSLASGELLTAQAVVLALDGPSAARLLPSVSPPAYRSVTTFYFSACELPYHGPYLLLNGEGIGPINNLCVLSQVAPSYSQTSQHLISVSVLKNLHLPLDTLEAQVRKQLQEWFGSQAKDWEHIRSFTTHHAQPRQIVPFPNPYSYQPHLQNGLFLCGDFCTTGTIDGALLAGRLAAEEVGRWLQR